MYRLNESRSYRKQFDRAGYQSHGSLVNSTLLRRVQLFHLVSVRQPLIV